MRMQLISAAAIAVIIAAFVTPADGSEKNPPIRLSKVQYDSPGVDDGSNHSLNAEWVQIINTTGLQGR
jgi:hypothetical protein